VENGRVGRGEGRGWEKRKGSVWERVQEGKGRDPQGLVHTP